MNLFFRILN